MNSQNKDYSSEKIYTLLSESDYIKQKKHALNKTDTEVEKALIKFLDVNPNTQYKSIYNVLKKQNIITYTYSTFCRKYQHLFQKVKREEKRKNTLTKPNKKKIDIFVLPDDDMQF